MVNQIRKTIFCIFASLFYVLGTISRGGVLADNVTSSHLDVLNILSEKAQNEAKPSATSFQDVSSKDWFFPYIDVLTKKGIIKGVSQTEFAPQNTFSYAEACTVIVRYLGLEKEATDTRQNLIQKEKAYSSQWYSGFIQLLYEMNIIDEKYSFISPDKNGLCDIDASLAVQPIKRHEFCDMISRSFELSNSPIKAKNVYFEIGGNASEFISSGFYDNSIVQSYKNVISDFELIPEHTRKSVLKAYSNGIFCGNQFGEFLPENLLTRAEMAKVIAVTCDFSLRTWAENQEGMTFLDQSDFETDASGNTYIKKESAKQILQSTLLDISFFNGDLTYNRVYTSPQGYSTDVYVYTSHGGKEINTLIGENSLHTQTKTNGNDIFCWYGNSGKVLIILRNLSQNSRVEAILEANLSKDGITDTNFAVYPPPSSL